MSSSACVPFCLLQHTLTYFHRKQKTSWADDVDEFGIDFCLILSIVSGAEIHVQDQPRNGPTNGIVEDSVDENGVRTVVEYVVNDDGKKVKVGCFTANLVILFHLPL